MLSRSLNEILQTELGGLRAFGGGDGVSENRLDERLTKLSAHSIRMFYIAALMTIILFFGMLGLLYWFRTDSTMLVAISTFCGTGVAGLVVLMIRISRELSQTGLVLALASELPQSDVLPAMQAIIRGTGQPDKT